MKRLSDKLVEQFNFRIKAELESAYLYDSMGVSLEKMGLPNAAKKWYKDANDEREHAKWAINYMLIMDVKPTIPVIAQQPQEYKGIKEVIDKTTEHEYLVTKQCNELALTAMLEKDLVTYNFVAQKYLTEQVEELDKCLEMQRYVNKFGDCIDMEIFMEDYFGKMI